MLRNILTPQVPALAAQHAELVLNDVLTRRNITPRNRHVDPARRRAQGTGRPAGDAGLTVADIQWSSSVLSEFGNVSSRLCISRCKQRCVTMRLRDGGGCRPSRRIQLSWRNAKRGLIARFVRTSAINAFERAICLASAPMKRN